MSAAPTDVDLIARVRMRVMDAVRQSTGNPHCTVRAGEGEWREIAPGIERKLLWERGVASSSMLRVAPGASFPAHGHPIDEECLVLEGTLRIGSLLLRAGDFHVGLSGVEHEAVSTQDGCLCFLRTAAAFFEPASAPERR
jgi:anti-sigma factor ChrR (cupin superfamily)